MSDDLSSVSSSELGHLTRTALDRLRDPMAQLTSAERESLNLARISAIAELGRRETETQTAAKSDAARTRLGEIEREASLHRAMIEHADSTEAAAAEQATRRGRLADLEREAALVQRNIIE